ncbi:MAG: FkbM family methyltransferase protein [Bacteroidetes bacterium]|nr:FkbM family methyltransferase protein [Bacteroidota bacterium]
MRLSLQLSLKAGDLLYKHAFPVYNMLYPVFKRRQDKAEISLIRKYVKPGSIVLDIGANIGFYTKFLSAQAGATGRVHAFEPDPLNFSYLQKNTANLPNVTLHNKAVSNATGILPLYRSDMLNVDHRTYPAEDHTGIIETGAVAADDVCEGHIDFIKIDIQGYEYFAFLGMQKLLHRNPDVKILSEFFPCGIKASGASVAEFFDFFAGKNFSVFMIEKNGSMRRMDKDAFCAYENAGPDEYRNLFICAAL